MAKKKEEVIVGRDSKKVGVVVNLCNGDKHHFPLGCRWRWAYVLGRPMFEVLNKDEGMVIFQTDSRHIYSVNGMGSVQPMWRSVEYPA